MTPPFDSTEVLGDATIPIHPYRAATEQKSLLPLHTAAPPKYSLLSLDNDIEYDNTRCTWLCCIEECK